MLNLFYYTTNQFYCHPSSEFLKKKSPQPEVTLQILGYYSTNQVTGV